MDLQKVYIGYDVGSNDDESCVTISKGLNLEACFYGKEAEAVFNLYKELTEREAKLVEALKKVASAGIWDMLEDCCFYIDQAKATLQELGIKEGE